MLDNLKNIIRDSSLIERVKDRTGQLAETKGRRPLIILSSIGQNDRNRIIKMLDTAFARWDFNVDVAPGNQTPKQAAVMAVENDVHIVWFLNGNGEYKKRASQLIDALKVHKGEDILVAVCGTVPMGALIYSPPILDLCKSRTAIELRLLNSICAFCLKARLPSLDDRGFSVSCFRLTFQKTWRNNR